MTRYSGPAFQEHRWANLLVPLSCELIPFLEIVRDNSSFEQAWIHSCPLFWTTAKSHFLSYGRGERSLGPVPRKPRRLKSLLQAAHLPPSLFLCCSACSVFFPHASLPKTNSARLPTQIFGIPGQPYICLCFGQEHVLSCLLQRQGEGRWLSPSILNRA